MNTKKILSIALVLVAGLFLANALPMVALADNPVPVITSLAPISVVPGSPAMTLTVNGSGFMQGSVVNVNGNARTTNYISAAQVTVALTAADLATAGNVTVSVTNPGPGGGTSNTNTLVVAGTNFVPTFANMSPTSVVAGSGAFMLTVNGSNFAPTSQIRFNGIPRTTTFVSANQLTTTIAATDVAAAGGQVVDVVTPAPGGGTSASTLFNVTGTTETPGLPNTGFGPREENAFLIALAAFGAIASTVVITVVAKKAASK